MKAVRFTLEQFGHIGTWYSPDISSKPDTEVLVSIAERLECLWQPLGVVFWFGDGWFSRMDLTRRVALEAGIVGAAWFLLGLVWFRWLVGFGLVGRLVSF